MVANIKSLARLAKSIDAWDGGLFASAKTVTVSAAITNTATIHIALFVSFICLLLGKLSRSSKIGIWVGCRLVVFNAIKNICFLTIATPDDIPKKPGITKRENQANERSKVMKRTK